MDENNQNPMEPMQPMEPMNPVQPDNTQNAGTQTEGQYTQYQAPQPEQTQYQQYQVPQQNYQQPQYQTTQPQGGSGFGVAALVLGIVALLLCWIPYVNITCTILAFILGIIGIAKNSGKGQAIAGVVLSVIAAIPTIIIMIFLNAIFGALGWFGAHIDNATEYWFNTNSSSVSNSVSSFVNDLWGTAGNYLNTIGDGLNTVGNEFTDGDVTAKQEGQGNGRIDMASGDVSDGVGHGHDGQTEGQRRQYVAAAVHRVTAHQHRSATAQNHQCGRADCLGNQFLAHTHSSLLCKGLSAFHAFPIISPLFSKHKGM